MRILPKINNASHSDGVAKITQGLIRREAKIGGELFGPVPKGHDRQFFCLDTHTWFWHESWSDRSGSHTISTRYEVRPNGIFKVQNGGGYQSLSDNETKNLLRAIELYVNKVISGYQAELQAAI